MHEFIFALKTIFLWKSLLLSLAIKKPGASSASITKRFFFFLLIYSLADVIASMETRFYVSDLLPPPLDIKYEIQPSKSTIAIKDTNPQLSTSTTVTNS